MGLFNIFKKRNQKKELDKFSSEMELITKPIYQKIQSGDYNGAYDFAKQFYDCDEFNGYYFQIKMDLCIYLIKICYKLNKDEEVDKYINTYKSIDETLKFHKDRGDCYYEIGKVMFEYDRKENAREYLQKAYDMSNGTLFLGKEAKEKYLPFLKIKDDRTFEDFSQDY